MRRHEHPGEGGLPLFDAPPADVSNLATRDPRAPKSRDDVQAEMVEAAVAERKAGRGSALIEAATGTGKTVVAAKLIRRGRDDWGGRFLFLVDSIDLAGQAEGRFRDWGLRTAVEMGTRRARDAMALYGGADVVIGSVDTLQRNRLAQWPADAFSDLIVDECHGATAASFRNVFGHFAGASFRLGLSATPYRADGKGLIPDPFATVAYRYPLKDYPDGRPGAVTNGHLVPVRAVGCNASVDLRGLKTKVTKHGKDYSVGDLEDRIAGEVTKLVNAARMELDRLAIRKAILFAPNVALAGAFAAALNQVGVSARAVHGESPDRKALVEGYRNGEYRVMCGCELFTKGFDDPPTEGLILLRPTKSMALFWQMIGRGTRICPEVGKTCCHAIGFDWEVDGDGPVSTLDLFLEDVPDPRTREIARAMFRRRKDADVMELVADARKERSAELDREREAQAKAEARALRVAAKRKDVAYRRREFDPLGIARVIGVAPTDLIPTTGEPLTKGQREVLAEHGLSGVGGLDRAAADKLIARCMDRDFEKLASPNQVAWLTKQGFDQARATMFSAAEAKQLFLERTGRGRVGSGRMRGR